MLASFSVRTRIVLLAFIPVAGFVANGFTYTSGEGDVGRTFDTFTRSAALADASRDFKSAVASMRIVVKDFNVKPGDSLVAGFEYAYAVALRNLDTIEASVDKGHAESIAGMSRDLNALREAFNNLVREQNTLGFDESSGLRRQLQVAGNAVERIINDNMSGLPETDANKLMVTLLYMRHHEADFRVTESEVARQQFQQAYKTFTDIIRPINATPEMKASLEQVVKTYAETFGKWVEGYDKVRPLHAVIDIDSQNMLPRADDIIAYARKTAETAGQQLTKSQNRTRNGIINVGIAMVALELGFSWLIGRSITRPLNGLARVMTRLADGDTTARIPATSARDEIGDMARTVIVFRDNMIERERLAQTQSEAGRAREQRSEVIASTISQFKHSVESALGKLRGASMKLEMSSSDLNKAADTVSSEADTATSRVTAASENVTAAASSVEELAASIGEIAAQASEVDRRRRTRRLRGATHRHDDVAARHCGHPHRRGGRAYSGNRRANQSARAERNDRGGARRRVRQRLCRRCRRSEVACRADRPGDRGNRGADRLNSVGGGRCVASHRASRRHHPRNVGDRHDGGSHRGSAKFRGRFDCRRRQSCLG